MAPYNRILTTNDGICPPGCTDCEDACRQEKGRKVAGIQSVCVPESLFYGIVRCNQCQEPLCAKSCPTGAITRPDGRLCIDIEKCVGCHLCTLACPYAGIFIDPDTDQAVCCDVCDDPPACVGACNQGILKVVNHRSVSDYIGKDFLSHGIPLCPGCCEELAIRLAMRVFGKETFVFTGPGCAAPAISAVYTGGFLAAPTFVCNMTHMPAVMTGVKRHYRSIGKEVRCVGFAGDGMTADVGFQPLSGAAERGENLIYICLDNEAYMNTGAQRSGTTPRYSWTSTTPIGSYGRGKRQEPKNMALIMADHNIPYAATATVAFPEDFIRKVTKAMKVKNGLSYIHVLVPCPTGWQSDPAESVKLSRLAVETDYFPLWESKEGRFSFTVKPKKRKPISDFTQGMGRFRHLSEEEKENIEHIIETRIQKIRRLVEMSQRDIHD